MSDEINNQDSKLTFGSEELKKINSEKSAAKLQIVNKVKKELSSGKWLLTQEILQEIDANHLIANPGSKSLGPSKSFELLEAEIKERYKEDSETRDLLLNSMPNSMDRYTSWRKLDGWTEAVWSKIRSANIFNNENRFKVIDSMFKKAIDGDTTAAKIWLTLSGDFVEKSEITSKETTMEKYREINQILHSKKSS